MGTNGKPFTEYEKRVIESAIRTFEQLGINVMAEFTKTGFHIIIPVQELANYFKRAIKEPEQLRINIKTHTLGDRAYIDIHITKR